MTNIPDDRLMTRPEYCAAVFQATGIKLSPATLATKATRGGGPPYVKVGNRAMIPWGTGLAWAKSLISKPRTSTSEADAVTEAAA